MMNDSSINSEAESYLHTQARLLVYTTLFWVSLHVLRHYKYELYRLKLLLVDLIQLVIGQTGIIDKIKKTKDQLKLELVKFNFIIHIQHAFRNFNLTIYRLSEFLSLKNMPNANLASFVISKLSDLIHLAQNLSRSLSGIANMFSSINIKWILQWPMIIRRNLSACSQQIRGFWQQIEQIIQIAKLPLEILTLVFSFIKAVGAFMRRIERPQIRRFR